MMLTIQDILPWKSGGKKIEMDAVLPFFIVPLLMILSTLSYEVTVTILTMIGMGALYVQSRPTQKNRSPFFFSWTLASGIYLFLIFEVYVLALFEITQNEHFVLLVLLAGSCYFFYQMKMTSQFGLASGPSKGKEYSPILTSDSCYCQICQIEVNERYFHTIWWDCCVVKTNYMCYLGGQLFAFCALLFGFDLAITTICRPRLRDEPVLLAKSCENMYMEFDTALGFVGCAYSITYLMVISVILVHQGIVYVPKYLGPKMRRLMSVYSHI